GRCVVRLIEPTEGKVMFLGEDISRISHRQFQKLRPKIQIVFQEPYDALNPRKKVRQILTDPLIVEG
ncbi:TPA: dipeptide/oligopeptide/nickel ABC transporter ATP-binding protein, partial [Candidatus Poribacteria bacterium]|nr:dipeptide/oligopeptide/nickel ABC transporter ATP-binding protein [Candidatus Poribacteria bacterium]